MTSQIVDSAPKVRARWRYIKGGWGGGNIHFAPTRHSGRLFIRLNFGPFALELRLVEVRALADRLHDLTDELEGHHHENT